MFQFIDVPLKNEKEHSKLWNEIVDYKSVSFIKMYYEYFSNIALAKSQTSKD